MCPLRRLWGLAPSRRATQFEFDEASVKYRFGGFFCACLLVLSTLPGRAQQQPTPAPEPGQNPPASPGPVTKQPPPLPPRAPDQSMPDEGKFSIGVIGWMGNGHQPTIDAGPVFAKDINGNSIRVPAAVPSRLQFQGRPGVIPGAEVTIPAVKRNAVRISYFRTRASGNVIIPTDLLLWGGNYSKGDYLATNYRLQNAKISYEFLTWPYPIESRRFRLKTLWQFQYTEMSTGFDAPLKANGPNTASGHKTLYAPSLGLGPSYYVTRHIRLEADASGFAIPHHWTIWDADADMAFRFGKLELRVGGKAFHFRTSPQADYYLRGTFAGAFGGLRFFLN